MQQQIQTVVVGPSCQRKQDKIYLWRGCAPTSCWHFTNSDNYITCTSLITQTLVDLYFNQPRNPTSESTVRHMGGQHRHLIHNTQSINTQTKRPSTSTNQVLSYPTTNCAFWNFEQSLKNSVEAPYIREICPLTVNRFLKESYILNAAAHSLR